MTSRRSTTGKTVATASPQLDAVLEFMRLLWNIEHELQRISKRMKATIGITGPQRLVLRIATERPGLSAGELAAIVHLHPSTITGVLERLVKKGLLERERDPRDGRRVRLRSRTAAHRLVGESSGTVEAAITRVLARLPKTRVSHAREVLAAIAESLNGEGAGAGVLRRTRARGRRRRAK